MFLTRITLSKSQAVQVGASDVYAWHRKLWEGFPGRDGLSRDFLFRIDDAGQDFRIFLVSEKAPVQPAWGYWGTKEVASSFLEHAAYRFQLRANPTMRRSSDRRRLGIYQENRLHDWMRRKAQQHGFKVLEGSLTVGAPTDVFFRKNGRRGKHVAVDFQGGMSVTDRDVFSAAFTNGIGSAKAFGFGLLMLQPVS